MKRPWFAFAPAFLGYLFAALLFTWPLPAHLFTHVMGPLSGDTGVYIWNLWAFRYELSAGRFPLFSTSIFVQSPPVDLSLHNYTLAFDLVAWPLLNWLRPVAVYNLLTLGALVVNGLAGFAVVRRVTGDARAAWLGGLVFGFSPFVIARTTGHLSLVLVAPLAVFWLALDGWRRSGSWRAAVGTGLTFTWALFTDPYYAVYCVAIAGLYVVPVRVACVRRPVPPMLAWTLDVLLAVSAALSVVIVATGGWVVTFGGLTLRMTTAYTPVLVATVLGLARVGSVFRWSVSYAPDRFGRVRPATIAASAIAALLPMSPWLYALSRALGEGARVSEPVFWRSSVPGVDVLGLVVPNPWHVLMRAWNGWFATRPGGDIENVAALSWVAIAVIAYAAWRSRRSFPRWWTGVTVLFGLLALGPFIHVAGVNTLVPGPWALLRYVPILSSARNPSRMAAVLMLGFAVVFGVAVARVLANRRGTSAAMVTGALTLALAFELAPLPRPLYSAAVPRVIRVIEQDPRPVTVLHLPFGLRDGTRTIGWYNTARMYYQTDHQKPTLGGYLSRVGTAEIRRQRSSRVIRTLLFIGEGGTPQDLPHEVRRARGARFVKRTNLGYVVVDRKRASEALVRFATESFGLELVASDEVFDLYHVLPYDGPEAGQNVSTSVAHARGVTMPPGWDSQSPNNR